MNCSDYFIGTNTSIYIHLSIRFSSVKDMGAIPSIPFCFSLCVFGLAGILGVAVFKSQFATHHSQVGSSTAAAGSVGQ